MNEPKTYPRLTVLMNGSMIVLLRGSGKIIFTQLTFMAIGGVAHGLSGLKNFLRETAKIKEGATFLESIGSLRETGRLSKAFSLYLLGQGKHLLEGVGFFFVLGAIGTSFGGASLFAEVALQGLILTSVVLGTIRARRIAELRKGHPSMDSVKYAETMNKIDEILKGSPWYLEDFIKIKSLLKFGEQQHAMLIALGLASSALQYATIIARVMMEL